MKRDWLLQGVLRIATIVLVAGVLLVSATAVKAAEEKLDDQWHFTIIPYVWLPSISGSLKLEPAPGYASGNVDFGSSNPLDNLKFAGMIDLQAQKGRWSLLADIMYVDFSDDNRDGALSRGSPRGWRMDHTG